VTFDLAPTKGGTKVTLTQANLLGGVKPSDLEHRAEFGEELDDRASMD
jgi:hypothetical protein